MKRKKTNKQLQFILIFIMLHFVSCNNKHEQIQGNNQEVKLEDYDNGLKLELIINKSEFSIGEDIKTKVRLHNTLNKLLNIHYLKLTPGYFTNTKNQFHPTKGDWRVAFSQPFMGIIYEWVVDSLTIGVARENNEKIKEHYKELLLGASYGNSYPSFTIPANSVIEWERVFKATEAKNYIDVGLFSLESFYPKNIKEKSWGGGKGSCEGRLKIYPDIWFGALYLGYKISIKNK